MKLQVYTFTIRVHSEIVEEEFDEMVPVFAKKIVSMLAKSDWLNGFEAVSLGVVQAENGAEDTVIRITANVMIED